MVQDTPTTNATHAGSEFVPYEYTTVRTDRDLEALHRDTYRNFGWETDGYGPTVPHVGAVELKLKRDRRIANRPQVLELQRSAEKALDSIRSLERSKSTAAVSVAIAIGIVGCAFLAGSIFTLNASLVPLSIVLGAIGLLAWLVGYLAHGRVAAARTTKVDPLIDHQYQILHDTGERANALLRA